MALLPHPRLRCALAALVISVVPAMVAASPSLASAPGPAAAPAAPSTQRESTRPNIIVVNTDDQRADSLVAMPKMMKWMAEGGTNYPNGYASIPSCCPSRATLMTGQYAHNNGQLTQNVHALNLKKTLQQWLKTGGYFTGHAGKFLHWLPVKQKAPGWDRWTYFKGGYTGVFVNQDTFTQRYPGYTTNLVFEKAIDYVDDFSARDDSKPFYLHLTPIAPHLPSVPEEQYTDAPVPPATTDPSFTETDKTDKPPLVQNRNHSAASQEATRADMVRTLYSVDDGFDRLMRHLQQTGELNNTLVIYTSDNGFQLGEHGLSGKFFPYTSAYAVPFLVRWPGHVAAGAVEQRPVTHLDIAPTVLAAAGATQHDVVFDGHDMLGSDRRDTEFIEYFYDTRNSKAIPGWATMKTATYQYTEYYDTSDAVTFREYYDLTVDPYQLENLYGNADPTDGPPVQPLQNRLAALRTCVGSACP